MSRQPHMNDPAYLSSTRGRRDNSLTRNEGESDSWRERYGQESASRIAGNVGVSADVPYGDGSFGKGNENMDAENWIHRDKLARIESEELQQAAILFHRRGTENKSGRGRYHESHHNSATGSYTTTPPATEQSEPWPNLHDEPPVPFNDDNAYESVEDERQNWDLRRPEEIAADMDDGASSIYRHPGLRKSSSRIPISTASPVPISPDHFGRESRRQRSRGPTGADEDSLSTPKPRSASEPTAADSSDNSTATGGGSRPPSRGTPSAQHNSGKRTPRGAAGSSNRKTSAPPTTRKTTQRSRATSGSGGSAQRPTTRSGESRPNTAANRPEGDPPWLATMYKPDPRLPPDQQILPTHARKMQQEQWEKERKSANTYDRDFSPLAINGDDPPRINGFENKEKNEKGKEDEKVKEKPEEGIKEPQRPEAAWPLGSFSKETDTSPKPGANSAYSTIPKVQETPQKGLSTNWTPPVDTAVSQPPRKEKGGCGCCIVM